MSETTETEFDAQTAVVARPEGGYAAELAPGWSVGGGLNGGYQLAVVGQALRAALGPLGKPDPISISAYYLSAAVGGAATVEVDVRRDGGSLATAAAELRQSGEARITALATYGDLATLGDDVRTTAEQPELPPVEECVPGSLAPEEVRRMAPLMDRFDMRFHPDQVGWVVGQPSGKGELSAWFRLAGEREPDPISLLLVVDALPPVTFDLGMPGWAPTLELTAHVRAVPAPGWLKVRHATRNLAGGMFEEDCEVWDSAGRLVAQSRQLARQPRG
ncbi:thioesterase family protein [Nocardioides ferulae]|uniref:thioesterase family protein n=1 Tax=Nocardioides ferulae TaxID=2340821 RepID=UPI001F0C82DE|nr:thioesterase family protein [Nocardioides ferulae]